MYLYFYTIENKIFRKGLDVYRKNDFTTIVKHVKQVKVCKIMMNTRLQFVFEWCILMVESIICLLIPSSIYTPYSSRFVFDTKIISHENLTVAEQSELNIQVIYAGLASVITFGAFGFGKLGGFGPRDVFQRIDKLAMKFKTIRQKKTSCSICLEKLIHNCKVLQCNHIFHESCINDWLVCKSSCPLCRRNV